MASLNYKDRISEESSRIQELEEVAGKGLLMPNCTSTSGARRGLHSTQVEQILPLLQSEVPYLQTGMENQFGKYSSDFVKSDDEYEVIAKIAKFSQIPEHHYFMIVKSLTTNEYRVYEKIDYKYISESYGYLYNNADINKYKVGDRIHKGDVLRKTRSFDEYNNRTDGQNLLSAFMACEHSKEDGIIFSQTAANLLSISLVNKVVINLNTNDIPLNLYGDPNDPNSYKCFPNIGETIKDYLMVNRKEVKSESLYAQDYNRLRQSMISDESFTTEGIVYDVNVYCNNVENLDSIYYSQIKTYYDENIRFSNEVVNLVNSIKAEGGHLDYNLTKLYHNCNKIINQDQYIKDRPFSNIIIEIMTVAYKPLEVGDKVTNRYGGKCVVSDIRPDEMMPHIEETGETIHVIYNPASCINRENTSANTECSINFASSRVKQAMLSGVYSVDQCLDLYINYLSIIAPQEAQSAYKYINSMNDPEQRKIFLDTITSNSIYVSLNPLSDNVTIDDLARLYQEFPFLKPYSITVPIVDSTGNVRYVSARRKLYCGCQYMYRLKQYGEEKFSVTSLSSTNLKNENSKNQDKKSYRSLYSKTPIRFGDMETGNLIHLGVERVIVNLMINSVSPQARRLIQQMLTDDPFNIDIKLTDDCSNRSAEILNAYLMAMGLRINFIKRKKKKEPAFLVPAFTVGSIHRNELVEPFKILEIPEKFDVEHFNMEMERKLQPAFLVDPFKFH